MNMRLTSRLAAVGLIALAADAFAGPGGAARTMGMPPMGTMGGSALGRGSAPPRDWPSASEQSAATRESHQSSGHAPATKADPATLLAQNSRLNARLQSLLPVGTTPQQACAGFSQLGACVAAIHAANQLDIPFTDLKSRLTGAGAVALGDAIQTLKPAADARRVRRDAMRQSNRDLASVEH